MINIVITINRLLSMDPNILYKDIIQRKYTDCVVTISDSNQTIITHFHKIILSQSKYFRNLFDINENEENISFNVTKPA